MMTVKDFGYLPSGEKVEERTIAYGSLRLQALTRGAVIRDLSLKTETGFHPLVRGFDRLEDYLAMSAYFGAVVGRCANRIAGGRFDLDGKNYQIDRNEQGRTHLHGGGNGFSERVWTVLEHREGSLLLELHSADGDQGYPGHVVVRCRYRLLEGARLRIELEGRTDAPTLMNLATHSYFNLDGGGDVRGHELTLFADAYTPVDEALIPTGAIQPVAGTALDFRSGRLLGDMELDNNFVLAPERSPVPRLMARLRGRKGISLEVWSTEASLQLFNSARFSAPLRFSTGDAVQPYCGVCLEPQASPDAVHHENFPSVVLRPGEVYRQITEYRFDCG